MVKLDCLISSSAEIEQLKTFKALYKEKIISFELYLIVEIYSIIKFIRRIIISKFRR